MAPNIGAILLVILSSWTHILPSSKAATSDSIHNKADLIVSTNRCCRTESVHSKSQKHCRCVSVAPAVRHHDNNNSKHDERLRQLLETSLLQTYTISQGHNKKHGRNGFPRYGERLIDKLNNPHRLTRNSTLNLIFQRLLLLPLTHKHSHSAGMLWILKKKKTNDTSGITDNFHSIQNIFTKSSREKSSPQTKRNWNRSYKNIFVYGRDDRTQITSSLIRKFPYSNIVRLSTGCTGTLITPFHVLTAAHCVHDGREFRYKLEMMKIEVPDPIGVRLYYIEKIGIPDRWLNQNPRRNYQNPRSWNHQQASFDYAVVKLSYGVHGRNRFLPLSVPTTSTLHHSLQFLGFSNYGYGLWRSECPARTTKPSLDGNLIFARCDSAIGNSGAALFTTDFRSKKSVVGVLSSTMSMGDKPMYKRYRSVITALTETKLLDICTELGSVGVSYGVCPTPAAIALRRQRFERKIKTIPFFG